MRFLFTSAMVLLVSLSLLLSSCGGGGGGFANDGSAASMLARINAVRTSTGKAALTSNAELQGIAQTHAAYMAGLTQLKPTDAAGTDLLVLVQDAGFGGNGRILSSGNTEAEIFSRLESSSSNQEIFNGAAYTLAGIGYATSSNSQWWVIIVSTAETS